MRMIFSLFIAIGILSMAIAGTNIDSVKMTTLNSEAANSTNNYQVSKLKAVVENRLYFANNNVSKHDQTMLNSIIDNSQKLDSNEIGNRGPTLIFKKIKTGQIVQIPFVLLYTLKLENKYRSINQILDILDKELIVNETQVSDSPIPFEKK